MAHEIKILNPNQHLGNDLENISKRLGHSSRSNFCRIELRKIADHYLKELNIRSSKEGGPPKID